MERGGGLPAPRRIPYFPEMAVEELRGYDTLVIAGSKQPVGFFGYPGGVSKVATDAQCVLLTGPGDDTLGALAALADELNAPADPVSSEMKRPDIPTGPIDDVAISSVIAALQPEGAIVMDEALTSGGPYFAASIGAPRFTHLMLTGGAIGEGPGASTGAAIACPDRKVIDFQADGCAAYSVQALWTQARLGLDVVTVICSNRRYNILNAELMRAGITNPGPTSLAMTSLGDPALDWVSIGKGFGVDGTSVDTAEGLAKALEKALSQKGPFLIEAVMT